MFDNSETEIQQMSMLLYMGMCEKTRTSKQVTISREPLDIFETLKSSPVLTNNDFLLMMSRSQREILWLRQSDIDSMIWLNNHFTEWSCTRSSITVRSAKTWFLVTAHLDSLYWSYWNQQNTHLSNCPVSEWMTDSIYLVLNTDGTNYQFVSLVLSIVHAALVL